MTEYVIKSIDADLLSSTEAEWVRDNEEIFLVNSSEMFIALRKSLESGCTGPHKSLYKGVFGGNPNVAIAIISMTETDNVGLTKLLNFHFSPDAIENLEIDEVADIYLTIIVNAFNIVDEKEHTVKIYGRDKELLSILKIVEKAGNNFWSDTKRFKMEGPWLAIRPIK